MTETMPRQPFQTTYRKMGVHRKRCSGCGRMIGDGERVAARQIIKQKFYPVKGLMEFRIWQFRHLNCEIEGWPNP